MSPEDDARKLVSATLGDPGEGGAYPNVRAVVRRLRATAALIEPLLTVPERASLSKLVDFLYARPDVRAVQSNPRSLRHYYGLLPAYCIFETSRHWVPETDWLRAIALLAMLRGASPDTRDRAFDGLGRLIRKYERNIAGDSEAQLAEKFKRAVAVGADSPVAAIRVVEEAVLGTVDPAVVVDHKWALAELSAAAFGGFRLPARRRPSQGRRRGGRVRDQPAPRTGQTHLRTRPKSRYVAKPRTRAERQAVREGLAPQDAVAPNVELSITANDENDLDLAEIVAMRSHRILQARPFSTFSDDCLSLSEARTAYRTLRSIVHQGDASQVRREASGLLLLQLFTAQALGALADLVWVSRPGRSGTITRAGEFTTDVPEYKEFRSFRSSVTRLPIRGVAAFRLPDAVMQALLDKFPFRARARVFTADSEQLQGEAHRLLHEMRRHIPRATADRIAGYLPAAVYEDTHDLRIAQLIFGSTFGLSTGPLYYYGPTNSSLGAVYDRCASRITDDEISERPLIRDWIVGSALACCDVEVARLVGNLSDRVQPHMRKGQRGRRPHSSWLEFLDALSRKTAWMFASASGWRNTNTIGDMVLGDFTSDFTAAMLADKVDARSPVPFRVASLGNELFPRQMRSLLMAYGRVLDSRLRSHGLSSVCSALEAALRGDGPIFLAFTGDEEVGSATAAWLNEGMPPDSRAPLNVMRHRMATLWRQCGGLPLDLYHQLGHEAFADQAFGPGTIQSPLGFIQRAAPVIDCFLAMEGWTVDQLDAKNYSEPRRAVNWSVLQSPRQLASRQRKSPLEAAPESARMTADEMERVRDGVATYWEADGNVLRPYLESGLEAGEGASRGDLNAAVHDICGMIDIDPRYAITRSVRERLCRLVEAARKRAEDGVSSVVRIPPFERPDGPVIVPVSLKAHDLMTHLRELKRRDDHDRDGSGSADWAFESVVVDILLWHPLRSADHFLALLTGIHRADAVLGGQGEVRVLFEIADKGAMEDWLAPHLAARIGRHRVVMAQVEPNRKSVLDAVTRWLTSHGIGVRRKSDVQWIIELGQEAGAIEWPGFLWSDITGLRVRRSLTPARSRQWRHDALPESPPDPGMSMGRPRAVRSWAASTDSNWRRECRQVRDAIRLAANDQRGSRVRAIRRLKELQREFVAADEPKSAAIAICLLALRLFARNANKSTGARLAAGSITGYVNVAIRALRLCDAELSSGLELAGIYDAILNGHHESVQAGPANKKLSGSASYFREKREALMRLHEVLEEDFGFDPIEPEDWPCALGSAPVSPYAEVLAPVEYRFACDLIHSWEMAAENSGSSAVVHPRIFRAARVALIFQYRLGLRPGESIGLETQDVWLDDGKPVMLLIRWNTVRRVKSKAGIRPISLTNQLTQAEISIVREIVKEQTQAGVWLRRAQPLLFWGRDVSTQAEIAARVLRLSLALTAGSERARQNISRHSAANGEFAKWLPSVRPSNLPDGVVHDDIWGVSRICGHSENGVTQTNYIHVDHLASARAYPNPRISKSDLALWLGTDLSNRRRWSKALAVAGKDGDSSEKGASEASVPVQLADIVNRYFEPEPQKISVPRALPPLPGNVGLSSTRIAVSDVAELLRRLSRGVLWGRASYPLGLLPSEERELMTRTSEIAAIAPALGIDQKVFISPVGRPLLADSLVDPDAKGKSRRPNFDRALGICRTIAGDDVSHLVSLGRKLFVPRVDAQLLPRPGHAAITLRSADQAGALIKLIWLLGAMEAGNPLVPQFIGPKEAVNKIIAAAQPSTANSSRKGMPLLHEEAEGSTRLMFHDKRNKAGAVQLICILFSITALFSSLPQFTERPS